MPVRDSIFSGIIMGFLVLYGSGCAASQSAAERADERAEVVGTWQYRAENISGLHRGTFQVVVEDGRLNGHFEDRWRGTLDAQVILHGSHMELALGQVRIAGRIMDNRFEGSVRSESWDVTSSSVSRRPGYFVARRVRSGAVFDDVRDIGCPSLLREVSYTCSPFRRQQPRQGR